jgi:primary-amine oxidase
MSIRRWFCIPLAVVVLIGLNFNAGDSRQAPAEEPLPGKPQAIDWEGWKFNWSVHPRAGVVLTDVRFRGRTVLKYAGLAEIFVPYNRGQPRPTDFGQGIAQQMEEIIPGKDCVPGSLRCQAFNAEGGQDGRLVVMLHEESTGLSYKGGHGRAYGKKLTLWNAYNLSGYHYINRWTFRDDGCLMPEIGLTGSLNHTGTGDASPYGSLVGLKDGNVGDGKKGAKGEKVFAPSHVHNIYYCLDFDIDGAENNVVEEFNYRQDTTGSESARHSWTPITKESSRVWDPARFRSWRVVNPNSRNALGLPRSYELIPGGNGVFRGASAESYAQAELWVTRYHADEYPVEKRALSVALPSYLNGESVAHHDVVVWYVLHVHHIPRTEDWPDMPIEWVGFTLKPRDFLDKSPVNPQ